LQDAGDGVARGEEAAAFGGVERPVVANAPVEFEIERDD
jgi:hypothetical protein